MSIFNGAGRLCWGSLSERIERKPDFYGSRSVGANYGLLFSAWGVCGFIVPGYFASIMEPARQAGDLAAGYNEVCTTLAGLTATPGRFRAAGGNATCRA